MCCDSLGWIVFLSFISFHYVICFWALQNIMDERLGEVQNLLDNTVQGIFLSANVAWCILCAYSSSVFTNTIYMTFGIMKVGIDEA